jgi:peptide chain release factor 3
MSLRIEAARRRTFAIISHPDAGKTTLTEKLLLLSGAIHIAGSVKARKAKRHATSDWMQIEKERGISVASSVMQMEYRDCVLNLLDTPGHQDFSEDTYRVLTAVDAALMVIDAANGVEPQTRRLLEVCRARRIPIITFINKLDREVRDPLSLIDEIEQALEMTACPFTWPVGMGRSFAGIYDLRRDLMRVFPLGRAGAGEDSNDADRKGASAADGDGGELAAAQCAERFGQTFLQADEEMNLIRHAGTTFDHAAFLAGRQTPVFFGSAVNNFGIPEVLDAVVDLAPAPTPRHAMQRVVQPQEEKFSAVVFKIQANMDPAHRDRIAFARICSGRFERGMQIKVVRTGKTVRPSTVVSFLSQRRDVLDAAFPGDIIGIPNRGTLQLGDSLTEGEDLQFTGLPFFAPEMFQGVDLADPMRAKQLNVGLRQLGEEGAIQVFRRHGGGQQLLGAVGALQFEVVLHRLEHEYSVKARLSPARISLARWITADDATKLAQFIDSNAHRIVYDAVDAPTFVCEHPAELAVTQERWPDIEFHKMREHGGLVFHTDMGSDMEDSTSGVTLG